MTGLIVSMLRLVTAPCFKALPKRFSFQFVVQHFAFFVLKLPFWLVLGVRLRLKAFLIFVLDRIGLVKLFLLLFVLFVGQGLQLGGGRADVEQDAVKIPGGAASGCRIEAGAAHRFH